MNRIARWTGIVVGLAVVGLAGTARAQSSRSPSHPFGLRLEPGLTVPLSTAQSDRFEMGAGQNIEGFYNFAPWLDVNVNAGVTELPSVGKTARSGTAWDFGAGVRLKNPVANDWPLGMSPWFDLDALYVRTGDLDRPGFGAGVGVSFPLAKNRGIRLGPFARYRQIIQADAPDRVSDDARLLHFGLSLEFGGALTDGPTAEQPAPPPEPEPKEPDCPEPTEKVVQKELPDADGDGFPDKWDRCPEDGGPVENWGCPEREKVEVEAGRLDLQDKIYFDFDKATLKEQSYPALNQTASILEKHRGSKVRVQGHADAIGTREYNQSLSERRAQTVVDYLVEQGVDRNRFVVEGYGEDKPVDSNVTDAGRSKNRRVEFDVAVKVVEE
ncbi:MAG: OmpA family protein [Bradymonadaceae bacterium]